MQLRTLMKAGPLPVRVIALAAVWVSGTVALGALTGLQLSGVVLASVMVGLVYILGGFEGRRIAATSRRAGGSGRAAADLPETALAVHFVAREFAAARRGRTVTLVMFGFSSFEKFTAQQGERAAATAVREFGLMLQQMTREMNISARYGWRGDSFLSVLSDADEGAAGVFIARVRRAVTASTVPMPDIEAGIAAFQPRMSSADEFVASAHRALDASRAAARHGRPAQGRKFTPPRDTRDQRRQRAG